MDHALDFLFKRLSVLDHLGSEEREALLRIAGPLRLVGDREDLISEGDRAPFSTLIVSGYAVRYNLLEDGRRQITAIHIPGDFIDLHSFLLKVMDHSVGAIGTCTMLPFQHGDLQRITEKQPHLTRLLWLSTLLDAALNREWVVAIGGLAAEPRLAHLICELYTRLKVVGLADEQGFAWPLTQQDCADSIGLSAVHLNRVLQQLRRKGLLAWEGTRVDILDWNSLAAVGQFDPLYLHLNQEPR